MLKKILYIFLIVMLPLHVSGEEYEIGFSNYYPPYNYLNDDGELVGFNVDILNAIKKLYQIDIKINVSDWSTANKNLEEGKLAGVAGAHYSGSHDNNYIYSRSIVNTEHCFLYNRNYHPNFSIEKFRSMREPTVALWKSDVLVGYIKSINPTTKFKFVNSYGELITMLDRTETTCIFAQRVISIYHAQKAGKDYILNLNHRILERNMGFKISKNNPDLAQIINNGLEVIFATGEYHKIYEKWIAPYEHNDNYWGRNIRYIITGSSLILGLFLLSLGVNYILKSRINKKTLDLQQQLELNSKIVKELEKQKIKAIESEKIKTAFLANMSHEIRTPMNGIIGFTDLLKNCNYSESEHKHFIDLIQQSGYRMMDTINNIIDVSKLESGLEQTKHAKVNIQKIVTELHSFFLPEAKNKELQLFSEEICTAPVETFISDEYKINSILTNLIKNAIKFTKTGHIKITYCISNDYADFWIEDTGIGISKAKQSTIFDQFVQEDLSHSRGFEGSGLGLSISKGYATLLGGSISLESETQKGSKFHVRIPNLDKTTIC
ncbi:transporter substrate-binding domain-containing protein [Marinilabiliaceae bacterium D04]|uniref:histidine kinase n=2 Tax=Plebeiibacterium marinum TaxID=2992111 RepID=A0AAE3MC62_9BACT|nr:transporter substrate-binding domain-containing protein [Plebeiobacterium marinum]